MLATWHFHIEISSKCTLKCSRCARQEVPHSLVNTELSLDFFKTVFTKDFVETNVEKITFCGDDGDPIYAHDLIPVIKYLKAIKSIEIVIITNGSYKKSEWWQELAQTLDANDSVHFSIDGYDNQSNNLYRQNSDYDSILQGLQTLKTYSKCKIVWATIAFRFNEEYIDLIKNLAKAAGADFFQLTKSTKFGSIYPSYGLSDDLQPSQQFVSKSHRFEREITKLSNKNDSADIHEINFKLYYKTKNKGEIIPLCEIGNKGLYIDSQGRLFPCCWVANRYTHNMEWQQLGNKFNLNHMTLTEALMDKFWETEFKTFKWQECKTKCSKNIVNIEYATSW